eukprot:CAMPEP_0203920690 /NCGR_PEP_ID=MMETSP0359-20131031/60956_1 /ASSEMBLY_ACC=CAM_ASM_000338 /TAXON_ID=268821 /ORGANISM="Scrippsiella Hangoei, Strain SHTV-5" /LENGTH=166 /DNA_ID=CAMNT_0050848241 /DNA_START=123 /DNA_END=623 /DNA_ORIENTATION=-
MVLKICESQKIMSGLCACTAAGMFVHAKTYADTTSDKFALTSSAAAILGCFGMLLASMVGMHMSLLDASDRHEVGDYVGKFGAFVLMGFATDCLSIFLTMVSFVQVLWSSYSPLLAGIMSGLTAICWTMFFILYLASVQHIYNVRCRDWRLSDLEVREQLKDVHAA